MTERKNNRLVSAEYLFPFILFTALFFMWGAARSVMDVLNKHFQLTLGITHTRAAMMQAMIYGAYFTMAIPGGILIRRYGTRRGVMTGLIIFGCGSLLFIPADLIGSFGYILLPLFVIGSGLVILETASNPYVTLLGNPDTAAGRLNMAQSFNGLGCICGVLFGGMFFFGDGTSSDTNIAIPYSIIGCIVLVIALCFRKAVLPETGAAASNAEVHGTDIRGKAEDNNVYAKSKAGYRHLLANKDFIFGLVALFFYEISEISINTFFISYVSDNNLMNPLQASMFLSFGGLLLFMCGRFAGSMLMRNIPAARLLHICSYCAIACMITVLCSLGIISVVALILCFAFESIMFPTIFALSIKTAGRELTEKASSVLMMSVVGGAVGPLLMGIISDYISVDSAFAVPLSGFVVVWLFSLRMKKMA